MNRIPKIIHYCWFGGKDMPESAKNCIDSWKKHIPDYELRLWNEETFDLDMYRFAREAYDNRKYAFVTDVVRLWAIYNYGGIYMDTDVEIIRPIDKFLKYPAFSGFEVQEAIPTGIMAGEKGSTWACDELKYYENRSFIKKNGRFDIRPNVQIITEHALVKGFVPNNQFQIINDELAVFPKDYFCPKSYVDGSITITENTYCIHHFAGSWHIESKGEKRLKKLFGTLWATRIMNLKNLTKKYLHI